jgi:hypothetical protein
VAPWEAVLAPARGDLAGVDFVLDVARWHDRRVAALRAHRTQHLSIDKCFFNQPDVERILASEMWRQAWGPPVSRRPAHDLFDGL